MKQYNQPLHDDVMTSDIIGYDVQLGDYTYNGRPIRRGYEVFELVDETRTPQQIVAELTACVEDDEAAAVEQIMHGQEAQQ